MQGGRWVPAKKRRQMLLLMRQLTEASSCHNSQVLALRQRKRDLVMQLNAMRTRLAEVDKLLGGRGMHVQLGNRLSQHEAMKTVTELGGRLGMDQGSGKQHSRGGRSCMTSFFSVYCAAVS